ncbi:myocardin-related transcription factor isoform X2 [Amblyomma americanum]
MLCGRSSVDGHRFCAGDSRPVYWGIQLDQDLLETIVSIYPEWFRDYNLGIMAEQQQSPTTSTSSSGGADGGAPSPPARVDEGSLQQAMDRNKESLKVKLLLRRPINQLVEQGIMPSLKTSPAFHEQRKNLERAKMGDYLKNKIQRRPDRQELIQQHILEDTTVDPSLQDKQRQLKKARLADGLNDRLSHRPGPLELVKGNILQTDATFAQAIKEGQIPFRRTCEGESRKHPPPPHFLIDEDSGGSDSLVPSPGQDSNDQSQSSLPSIDLSESSSSSGTLHEGSPSSVSAGSPRASPPVAVVATTQPTPVVQVATVAPTPTSASSLCASHQLQQQAVAPMTQQPSPLQSFLSTGAAAVVTPSTTVFLTGTAVAPAQPQQTGGGKAARKKSKSKAQPKARTIKFHEYKGPPSAQKNQPAASSSSESSYELLLQQQQLFLQWQLEWQQKYPQIILPAAQKPVVSEASQPPPVQLTSPPPPPPPLPPVVSSPPIAMAVTPDLPRTRSKLEDMKVSDLKAELKRRNLPVSGSKPQLIERLKPFSDIGSAATQSSSGSGSDQPVSSVEAVTDVSELSPPSPYLGLSYEMHDGNPPSVVPMEVDGSGGDVLMGQPDSSPAPVTATETDLSGSGTEEDLMKIQQQRIEELQRELQRSQLRLQQKQQQQVPAPYSLKSATPPITTFTLTLSPSGQAVVASQPQTTSLPASGTVPSTGMSMVPTPTTVADSKSFQRQLLQQHLQNKIQQQQQQQAQQQQQQQQQQSQQQAHQQSCVGNPNLATSLSSPSPSSAAVKASLANFLQQQQQHQQQQQQQQSLAAALAIGSDANNNHQLIGDRGGSSARTLAYGQGKQPLMKTPNGLQSRSLQQVASFPSLLTPKPEPFVLTKQPPDYDEATKQLNKTRQAQMLPLSNLMPASSKQNRPRSVKSKDVDDVLEILIKNGELPPSAAQEPPTPTTPGTPITDMSGLLACTSPSFPTPPPSSEATTATPGERNSPSLALSGDGETPPPSASLDFDFHLDLDDFEGMDLGMLTDGSAKSNQAPRNHYAENTDLSDPTLSMEIELSDWLDVMMPQTSSSSSSSATSGQVSSVAPSNPAVSSVTASSTTQHDPLLSTNASVDIQDPFDLFTVNDTDFRAWDDFRTNWDSADFIA